MPATDKSVPTRTARVFNLAWAPALHVYAVRVHSALQFHCYGPRRAGYTQDVRHVSAAFAVLLMYGRGAGDALL